MFPSSTHDLVVDMCDLNREVCLFRAQDIDSITRAKILKNVKNQGPHILYFYQNTANRGFSRSDFNFLAWIFL